MKRDDRRIWYAVGVAALIAAAYFMDQLDNMTTDTVAQAFVLAIRNVIHISLIIGWCVSLRQRIINAQVRRRLAAIGILMAFWLTAKVVKYEFIASRSFWLGRYIWYSYYIPTILIPLLGVFIIDHIGKPEGYRNPRWMDVLYIPALAILTGIFTNDLHQLAFDFPQGVELFDSVYGYGPVYFAAMAWFVLLGIYFVLMLLRKNRVPGSRGCKSCLSQSCSAQWCSGRFTVSASFGKRFDGGRLPDHRAASGKRCAERADSIQHELSGDVPRLHRCGADCRHRLSTLLYLSLCGGIYAG